MFGLVWTDLNTFYKSDQISSHISIKEIGRNFPNHKSNWIATL